LPSFLAFYVSKGHACRANTSLRTLCFHFSASGIAHARSTGNSGYSGGVSGASVAPTAAVDPFNPRTDLASVIDVVAVSTAFIVSSVPFAASAGANDNSSYWGDFEKPLDMLLEEEIEI